MEVHFKLSDTEFEEQFKNCELNPSIFSHEAHLRLVWIHINNYGVGEAIKNVQLQLQNFVTHIGAKDKYNATLTIAAVKAVNHFMLKSKSSNFEDFIQEFPRLKYNFKDLMAFHYGIDIYNSKEAKAMYLEPDLLPFE